MKIQNSNQKNVTPESRNKSGTGSVRGDSRAIKVFIFSRMKFRAAFILSLSLLVSSSFAVSLTPPMVLKMQEDRSMADSEEFAAENDFSPFRYLVGGLSIGVCLAGFVLMTMSGAMAEPGDDKIALGTGIGMMALGGVGIYWAF